MTTTYYRSGHECIAVETGMPEQPVQIGTGNTPREALENLQATPIQSAGRDAGERALDWAKRNWEIGSTLELLEVTEADMDDRMSAWPVTDDDGAVVTHEIERLNKE